MVRVMPAVTQHKPVVIAALSQRRGHLQVAAEPVHLRAVTAKIPRGRLHVNAQWLGSLRADQLWIGVAAGHLREAGEEGQHAAEAVGAVPRDGESAVAATAATSDGPLLRVVTDPIGLTHPRQPSVSRKVA